MACFVALLRGVNVGGHRMLPMNDLRAVAEELGLRDARTYLASGNLIFGSDRPVTQLEKMLEEGLRRRVGFDVDVVIRSAAQWDAYCAANPFPAESERDPQFVMMTIGRKEPTETDLEALAARAVGEEKVALAGHALWIYFAKGAGRSRLGAGTSKGVWTSRNWRTIVKLREMLTQ